MFLDDSAKPSNAIANGRGIKTRKAKDEFEFRACVRGELKSPAGCVVVPIEVTDKMAPGVISLPHGWGHDLPGVRLSVATQRPGQRQSADRRPHRRHTVRDQRSEWRPGRADPGLARDLGRLTNRTRSAVDPHRLAGNVGRIVARQEDTDPPNIIVTIADAS